MDLWHTEEMHMQPTVPLLAETQLLSRQMWQRENNCLFSGNSPCSSQMKARNLQLLFKQWRGGTENPASWEHQYFTTTKKASQYYNEGPPESNPMETSSLVRTW